jgi:Zn-dependent protease
VLLQEPGRTHYDMAFSLFGIPVRIHPGFFVLPLLFGSAFARIPDQNPGMVILIFTVVFFLSILVHELGHSLAFRSFGIRSRIVLYWFGGLAIPETTWNRQQLSPNQQIIVSAAGPFAGFGLAGFLAALVLALGGQLNFSIAGIFPLVVPVLDGTAMAENQAMWLFFVIGLFCNVVWSVLNLAPVFPLDGGQISAAIFQQFDPRTGLRNALVLSLVAAAVLALLGFANGDQMMGVFFAFMAFSSWMTLQQYSGFGGGRFH